MLAARNSDEGFFDGGLARDASRRFHKWHERAVDFLSVKGGDDASTIHRPNSQIYSWRRCAQSLYQRNQHGEDAEVCTANGEGVRLARVESGRRFEQRVCAVEDVSNGGSQGKRPRCRFDTFGMPHEQWIVEHCSEPTKCMACSRLRQVKPLGRSSNMALRQQPLKHDQQVEVGTPKIDFFIELRNTTNWTNRDTAITFAASAPAQRSLPWMSPSRRERQK